MSELVVPAPRQNRLIFFKKGGLVLSLVLITIALFMFIKVFQRVDNSCKFGSLKACMTKAAAVCGEGATTPPSSEEGSCEAFVSEVEPCVCKACMDCFSDEQRMHCARSIEDRLVSCRGRV